MPEPFLWYVFYHLVEAAVAMQYGPTEGGWGNHEVVHRDIKPGNGPSSDFHLTLRHAYADQSSWTRRTGKVESLSIQAPNWATGASLARLMPMVLIIHQSFTWRELLGIGHRYV